MPNSLPSQRERENNFNTKASAHQLIVAFFFLMQLSTPIIFNLKTRLIIKNTFDKVIDDDGLIYRMMCLVIGIDETEQEVEYPEYPYIEYWRITLSLIHPTTQTLLM